MAEEKPHVKIAIIKAVTAVAVAIIGLYAASGEFSNYFNSTVIHQKFETNHTTIQRSEREREAIGGGNEGIKAHEGNLQGNRSIESGPVSISGTSKTEKSGSLTPKEETNDVQTTNGQRSAEIKLSAPISSVKIAKREGLLKLVQASTLRKMDPATFEANKAEMILGRPVYADLIYQKSYIDNATHGSEYMAEGYQYDVKAYCHMVNKMDYLEIANFKPNSRLALKGVIADVYPNKDKDSTRYKYVCVIDSCIRIDPGQADPYK
jgi:hypothetical protein